MSLPGPRYAFEWSAHHMDYVVRDTHTNEVLRISGHDYGALRRYWFRLNDEWDPSSIPTCFRTWRI